MWIEEKINKLYKQISGSEKVVFISTFVCGLIAHLYIYTNTIPNFDGISRMYDEQQMTIVGRWFLHYASWCNSYTQMPMVIGVLAMLFLAAAAALVIHMFRIESWLLAGMWGAMFAVFPAIADTNAYTYTASAYCIAIFLATLGIVIAEKKRWGFLYGAIFLVLSMGIYQTYVTVAITLAVLLVIQKVLNKENQVKDILAKGIQYIIHIALGTVIYYVVLKIFLYVKNLTLCSYLGMSNVESSYPFSEIGTTLAKTYSQVWEFFFVGTSGVEGYVFIVPNVVIGIASLILLAIIVKVQSLKQIPIKLIGLVIMLLILPMAVNFTQVISPYSSPRLLMKFSFVYLYLLPVVLAEKVKELKAEKKAIEVSVIAVLGCFLMLSLYFWQYDNLLYTLLNQTHRATLSFVTNVVSRVESCAGYQTGMEVVIIGGFPSDRYDTDIGVYARVSSGSTLSSSVIPLNKHIYYYMNDWLNVPVEEPEEEVFIRIAQSETFKQMPLYPDDGSVAIIDNCVVVKMSETFTPKSLYEKEYEERR